MDADFSHHVCFLLFADVPYPDSRHLLVAEIHPSIYPVYTFSAISALYSTNYASYVAYNRPTIWTL